MARILAAARGGLTIGRRALQIILVLLSFWTIACLGINEYPQAQQRQLKEGGIPGFDDSASLRTTLDIIDSKQEQSASVAPSTQPTVAPTTTVEPSSRPTAEGEARVVGNNGDPSDVFPLQQCQADCDRDRDCDWGLVCQQRDEGDDVPGCDILDEDHVKHLDFCVPSPDLLPGAFRLKKYWREGYEWQNSTEEMWYCMTSHYKGYYDRPCCRGKCWYLDGEENVAKSCRSDQVYIEHCIGSPGPEQADFPVEDKQQAFRFLTVEKGFPWDDDQWTDDWYATYTVDSVIDVSRRRRNNNRPNRKPPVLTEEEVLIQLATTSDQRCLEREGHEIFLAECNPGEPRQRWAASNGSRFYKGRGANRFEISQHGFDTQCLCNAHHPKPGEVVELHHCESLRKRDSQSNFWSVYEPWRVHDP